METQWIKVRTSIVKDPKVFAIADRLAGNPAFRAFVGDAIDVTSPLRHRYVTVGVTLASLIRVWSMANESGKRDGDDLVVGCATLSILDAVAETVGFGEALQHVGWALEEIDGTGSPSVRFPKFLLNNVPMEDRKKATSIDRQRRYRDRQRNKAVTHGVTGDVTRDVTRDVTGGVTVTPRVEKSREEKIEEKDTPKPPLESQPKTKKKKRVATEVTDPRFVRFWDAYPNKAGKADAWGAWQDLAPSDELVEIILKAIEDQKKSIKWQEQDGKFIHDPVRWIRGGRWEDRLPLAPAYQQQSAPNPVAEANLQAIIENQRERTREIDELRERARIDREARLASQAEQPQPSPTDEEDNDDAPPPF